MPDRNYPLSDEQFTAFYASTAVANQADDDSCLEWVPRRYWFSLGRMRGAFPHEVAYSLIFGPIPDGMVVSRTCLNEVCLFDGHLYLEPVDDLPVGRDRVNSYGRAPRSIVSRFLARMSELPRRSMDHWYPLPTDPVRRRRRYVRFAGLRAPNPYPRVDLTPARRQGFFYLVDSDGAKVSSLDLAYEHLHGRGSIPSGLVAFRTCSIHGCHQPFHLALRRKRPHRTRDDMIMGRPKVPYSAPEVQRAPRPTRSPNPIPTPTDEAVVRARDLYDTGHVGFPRLAEELGLNPDDASHMALTRDVVLGLNRTLRVPTPSVVPVRPDPRPVVTPASRPRRPSVLDSLTPNDVSRFVSMVAMGDPGSCWPFLGALNAQGFGVFKLAGRLFAAHVVAYVILRKSDPSGQLRHPSDGPRSCCNPHHWVHLSTLRGSL